MISFFELKITPPIISIILLLYGVSLGAAFFGESMFSRRTNASKISLVYLVERLKAQGFVLLDTQFTTEHLKTFGAIDMPKAEYETLLHAAVCLPHVPFRQSLSGSN